MVGKIRLHCVFAVFFLMSVLVCGCGLFEPRTPEPPGGGGTWVPPTTPEIVLENMINSMDQKVIGNYVQNLTADTGSPFVFHPDPSDSFDLSSTFAGVYDNWTRDTERIVTQTIFDEAASLDLTFTKRDTTVYIGVNECVLYYKYWLQITSKLGTTEFFRGLVEYHLRREGSYWYICMWIDKRDPDFSGLRTWGNLKGTKRPRE
jgi:hypothetical protein